MRQVLLDLHKKMRVRLSKQSEEDVNGNAPGPTKPLKSEKRKSDENFNSLSKSPKLDDYATAIAECGLCVDPAPKIESILEKNRKKSGNFEKIDKQLFRYSKSFRISLGTRTISQNAAEARLSDKVDLFRQKIVIGSTDLIFAIASDNL